MCEVVEREQRDQTSLAIIRAGTVHDLVIEAEPKGWDPEKEAVINQPSLFAPDKTTLKPVPYKFKYRLPALARPAGVMSSQSLTGS
jgi:hypothetical protein